MSFKRHRFFVLLCTLAALLGGWAYLLKTPKQYESIGALRIQSADPAQPGLTASGAEMIDQAARVGDRPTFAIWAF